MPLATGGSVSVISISGITYYVHTFTTSGSFTVSSGGSFEYLVVAGGGGGADTGGGGAGGYRSSAIGESSGGGASAESTLTLTSGIVYTITVGAGGPGSINNDTNRGTNGGNSSIAGLGITTVESVGGGGGGAAAPNSSISNGAAGGSGGGGSTFAGSNIQRSGGSPAAGQGFAGGAGAANTFNGGGGGGAGSAGGAASGTTVAGNGGAGLTSSITGTPITRAGGGGGATDTGGTGGAGGSGGGGAGGRSTGAATAGTANTGGGGGGSWESTTAGAGGSGIVIIRYLADNGATYATATGGNFSTQVINTPGFRNTYGIHTFTSSGNLTITQSGLLEYLIVGGGGGGGSDMGGGGGAGGYLAGNVALNAGTYTVTVGAGGSGAPAGISQVRGTNGASSAIVPFGFKGHSFSFDGTGDGVNCGTRSAFALGTGAFCLEAWIYCHRLKDFSALWTTRPDNANYADAYHIGCNAVGGISLYVGSTSFAGAPTGTIKAGRWHHIAVTRNSFSNLALFVDGLRMGYTSSLTTNFTRTLLGLGDFPTTKAEGIDGYISNARIVVGNFVYDPALTTCTVPTEPLTAITGTAILTAQDFSFTDNSANNFTLTAQGNVLTSHFTPFSNLGLGAAGGGGGASEYSNNSSPAASGGSGGGTAGDISTTFGQGIPGQGFAGGASGGRYYPSGGGGAGGAGSNIPANGGIGRANAILGTTYWWAGGGGGAGYTGISGNGGLGGGGGGAPKTTGGGGLPGGSTYTQAIAPYALVGSFGTIGSLNAATNVPGGNGVANSGGGGGGGAHYSTNNFGGIGGSGIVIVKYLLATEPTGLGGLGNVFAGGGGGAGMDGYIGVTRPTLVRAFTSSGNLTVTGSGTVEYLIVGGGGGGGSDMGGGGGGGGYLAGNVALSTGTYLVTVGAGGAGAPAGISQPRGRNGGDSAIQPFANSAVNYSYFFDTNGDFLSLASNAAFDIGSNAACVELWFWMYRLDGTYHSFCGQNSGTASTIRIGYNSGSLYYSINNDTARGANTSVDIQTWYHVVVTYTGGTARFFVNGQLRDVTTGLGNIGARAEAYIIGQEDSIWMDGYISNFRFCNGSIPTAYQTASNTLYAQIFAPPTAPLTTTSQGATAAHVRILTCQSATIVDNSPNNFTITRSGDVAAVRFNPWDNLIAAGGGGGASEYSNNNSPASSGGSGGGNAGDISTTFGQGIRPNVQGLVGQGFAGGATAGRYYPSGGGGAGAAGSSNPANGGNGVINTILGTSYYWAAGGGGAGYTGNPGNGGLGGGGGGAPKQSSTVGVAGTGGYNPGTDGAVGSLVAQSNVPGGDAGTNTGSGGGGGAHYNINNYGGNGGSGIIVIKYRPDLLTITGGQIVLDSGTVIDTVYAGGFGGNGFSLSSGQMGTLGGAGGGGTSATIGAGGGGIDVWGAFNTGAGGAASVGGGGGSANQILGVINTNGATAGSAITGNGGLYGGGGGGSVTSTYNSAVGNGAGGALMFVWSSSVNRPVPTYPALAFTNTNNFGSLLASNTTNSLTLDKTNFVSAGFETPLVVLENSVGISRTANTIIGTNFSDGAPSETSTLPLNYSSLANLYKPSTPLELASGDLFTTAINVLRDSLGISTVISTQADITVNVALPPKTGNTQTVISTQTTANIVSFVGTPTGNVSANNVVSGQATVTVFKQDEWMLLSSDPDFPVDYNTTYNYTAAKPVTVSNDPRNKYLRANYLQKDVTGQSPTDPQEYL